MGSYRLVSSSSIRVRGGGSGSQNYPDGRRRCLPAHRPRGLPDDSAEATCHHLPRQQSWLHYRGGDPRRTLLKNKNDYSGLINKHRRKGRGFRATNGRELTTAIKEAIGHKTGPTLIECTIERNDATKELLEWGTRVAAANSRPQQRT